jgi:hypothetical protein
MRTLSCLANIAASKQLFSHICCKALQNLAPRNEAIQAHRRTYEALSEPKKPQPNDIRTHHQHHNATTHGGQKLRIRAARRRRYVLPRLINRHNNDDANLSRFPPLRRIHQIHKCAGVALLHLQQRQGRYGFRAEEREQGASLRDHWNVAFFLYRVVWVFCAPVRESGGGVGV